MRGCGERPSILTGSFNPTGCSGWRSHLCFRRARLSARQPDPMGRCETAAAAPHHTTERT